MGELSREASTIYNTSKTNLIYNWNELERSRFDIDILGCLLPDEPGIILIKIYSENNIVFLLSAQKM